VLVGDMLINVPEKGKKCWMAPKPCAPKTSQGLTHQNVGYYSVFTGEPKIQIND